MAECRQREGFSIRAKDPWEVFMFLHGVLTFNGSLVTASEIQAMVSTTKDKDR